MASVYRRGERWYLRYKDSAGRWCARTCTAPTKTEAKRLALELERTAERQRLGLEQAPPEDGGGLLRELLSWWLDTYLVDAPSYTRTVGTIRRHLLASDLATLRLADVTSGRVETFLQTKSRDVSPQTVNHLRGYLSRAFNLARRTGRWLGTNPVADVAKRKVPRRVPDYLKAEEVVPILAALPIHWRPLFATAIYTGLRKGELLGLRKVDVDLRNRLLTVARSYGRDTTKGGHADVIPIAAELVPYLEAAIACSPSPLIFPHADGGMMSDRVQLERVLRRALHRAGIVTG